ncbi:MAG: xanthine dehydrogenase family protein molybdopterin-binding subunit [Actinomycetota bacterium]
MTRQTMTGRAVLRGEDRDLLTGRARYVADVRNDLLVGAVHVAFVRSPYASGVITGIDAEAARNQPGVLAVVTAADIAHLHPGAYTATERDADRQPLLLVDRIGFAGEPVVAVVAETEAQAADAAEFVEVDYEADNPVVDVWEALERGMVYDRTDLPADHDRARFDKNDVVVTERYVNPRQSPAPIEPRTMACVWSPDGHLHVWAATQTPHGFRSNLVATYGIDQARIHVTAPAVGGGFGGKVTRTPEEHLLPELARVTGRPVRWNETRSEYFATATQGRGEHLQITLAGAADGRFDSIRIELVKDGGAYPGVGTVLAEHYGRAVGTGVYDIPNAEFASLAVRTNLPSVSAFRGAGRGPIIAAIERTVDRYAAAVGIDPAELRRRNLVQPTDMPYRTATGATLDEADYPGTLQRALDVADYDGLRRDQADRRSDGDERQLGIGIGCYNHMTLGAGGEEAAVRIKTDGSVVVVTGSTSQGHGHATTWAQIAGDALGVPVERVTVIEGSTDAIGSGQGAVASRSAQTAGVAVHRLSNQLVDLGRSLAADHLEAAEADLVLATDGEPGFHVVGSPTASVSWATLATLGLDTERELACGEYYDAEGKVTFPSGCHLAVVEVDTATGHVQLLRLVAVDDAGPRLNPMIVEGQLHGGIACGASQVLGEVMAYDGNGNPVTANFADYAIGSIDWFPSFEVVTDRSDVASSFNELGVKGVGESGTIGATPAVHNSIIDALSPLGVQHIDLPCTPRRIWEAIAAASGGD